MYRLVLGSFSILALSFAALAQSAKDQKPGDAMIEKYLAAETDKLSKRFLDGARTIAAWQEKRPRLYREYMDMLGLWPVPEKTPLKATFTGTIEAPDFFIDKLHFQSKPGLYVTANLYRPAETEYLGESGGSRPRLAKKYPAVLYVCGHSNQGRNGNKSAYQDHGIWFARNGYICLIVDSLQLGEIPGVHHGTYGRPWNHLKAYGIEGKDQVENRWWWQAMGYTPAGVECWNGIRGIDYLVSRPDVDADRIAVTGISGGGAATFWIAAADERVKCAVPVSGMSDLESYVKNKVINGHCDCMFLYNTYQWDWTTIAALVAPRPLLFANSDNDPIFPMDANRRIIAKLRKIYTMYGKPELVDEYVSKGGHAYRPDLRIAIFKWINRHVKDDVTTTVNDVAPAVFPGNMVRVFRTDTEIPMDNSNANIDEAFVSRMKTSVSAEDNFSEWRKNCLDNLKSHVFRPLPRDIPPATSEKRYFGAKGKDDWALATITAPGVELQAGPAFKSGQVRFLHIVSDTASPGSTGRAFEEVLRGKNFWYLFTRRTHVVRKSPPNYDERAHVLLGQTVDLGQIQDIIATFKSIQIDEKASPAVVGVGPSGILAAYAALFEPSIKEVIIIDPPKSHKQGPTFLNVLRVLDIPEALGLLAPETKLTLINARDPAFERTAEVYRIAGAADKFIRK